MQVDITEAEREELVKLLENAIAEKRYEVRRTRNSDWVAYLQAERKLDENLLARLSAEAS